MDCAVDVDALRRDLAEHFEDMAYCGMPAFLIDAADVRCASSEKLLQIAQAEHIDLRRYMID